MHFPYQRFLFSYYLKIRNFNGNVIHIFNFFKKGNLFRNLYNEYKNYKPAKLIPKDEREKKLYDLSAICFAAHELNLYLDLNPEDQSAFMLFMDYEKQANRLIEEYERLYGPLNINSEEMKTFTWSSDKWPWEGKNV